MAEWTVERLQALIDDDVSEGQRLEYKACGALLRDGSKNVEISKDVSAFANAEGGIIVYGLTARPKPNQHLAESIDTGYDPAEISNGWLEAVIQGNIRPAPPRFALHEVPHHVQGRVLYVVDIDAVLGPPRMASDHTYYVRRGSRSTPMEEFEVRNFFLRDSGPDLAVRLDLPGLNGTPTPPDAATASLHFSVNNRSDTPSLHTLLLMYVDERVDASQLVQRGGFTRSNAPAFDYTDKDVMVRVNRFEKQLSVHAGRFPIFRSIGMIVLDNTVDLVFPTGPEPGIVDVTYIVGAEVDAPRMSPKGVAMRITFSGGTATVRLTDYAARR